MATKRRWLLPGAIASILIIFLVLAFIPDPIPVDTHTVESGPFAVFVEDDAVAAPAEGPPNILLISIDSLRADHLGWYGYEKDTSPVLDELAAS